MELVQLLYQLIPTFTLKIQLQIVFQTIKYGIRVILMLDGAHSHTATSASEPLRVYGRATLLLATKSDRKEIVLPPLSPTPVLLCRQKTFY